MRVYMSAPSRNLDNVALVLQQQKVTDFFDKLNDMRKLGSRRIRIGIMESEKPQIRGRTIRLLPNKKDLNDKVLSILNKSDIREANRLILTLVSKGLGVIEEQALDGRTWARMTPEAHKKYKDDQQKPQTAENGKKKKIVYAGVTEVSKEEFHKLAKVASVALKIELEPLKQEKAEAHPDKDHHKEKETETHAKPHLREVAAQDEESHDAPSDTESSHPGKAKEESQAAKILELQQAHAVANREKEEAALAREKAAAVVRKEVRLDEKNGERVKAEVTASEQAKSLQKSEKEKGENQPSPKDAVSSIDAELAAIEPPPSEDR